MLISFFTDNIIIQTSVFIISSSLLIFLTKPFINKFTHRDNVKTNAYSIIGRRGIVIKDIDPITGEGQVKIGTEVWTAKSSDDRKIEKGLEVEVVDIDGVKAVVN